MKQCTKCKKIVVNVPLLIRCLELDCDGKLIKVSDKLPF